MFLEQNFFITFREPCENSQIPRTFPFYWIDWFRESGVWNWYQISWNLHVLPLWMLIMLSCYVWSGHSNTKGCWNANSREKCRFIPFVSAVWSCYILVALNLCRHSDGIWVCSNNLIYNYVYHGTFRLYWPHIWCTIIPSCAA